MLPAFLEDLAHGRPKRVYTAEGFPELDRTPVPMWGLLDLCLLAASPGHVFTRETILERVWGWGYEGTVRTVDNYVVSLRRKLGSGRRMSPRIRTVPRVGYTLDVA